MDEDREGLTPFWVQGDTGLRRSHRLRRRLKSVIFSSGILVFLLLVSAVFFLLFIVHSTSIVFIRASDVKKNWDLLNVVLVFLAIIFGALSRNKNELQKSNPSTPNSYNYRDEELQRLIPPTVHQWAESSNRNSFGGGGASGGLRRTYGSYPDLCEMSPRWVSADDQWRFVDDTLVDASRLYDSGHLNRRRSWRGIDRSPEAESKNLYVDMGQSIKEDPAPPPSSPPPPPPSSPPDPPPAPAIAPVQEDTDKPTNENIGSKRKTSARKKRDYVVKSKDPMTPPAAFPPPPPPPPPPSGKSGRKRGGTSATKEFIINSLYHKRKRKHRSQSVDNLDALLHTSQPSLHFQIPPPSSTPPPPPPPPPSVFHSLFSSKKSKRKKNVRATPTQGVPPPPPPPAANPRPTVEAPTVSRARAAEIVEAAAEKPNHGGESPLIPIPPPPPPPPFYKKPAWKFVVQGDYVRIDSFVSSRSASPDPEEVDSDVTPRAAEVGRNPFPPSPLFCPSPDVNTKAENFISKFRAGLKLEKMNSVKGQGLGLSNLGPAPDST